MDPSGYHQQEQQQQQQSYDPSQFQAYDQSSQAYYAYNQQYGYYPSQSYTDYYSQQQYHQFQQEPTSIHPPGVPITPESAHSAGPGQTQMQNQQLNPVQGSAVTGSVNSEAIAVVAGALAQQLTNYSGNVDGVQHAMRAPIGQSQYRGRGRRGGRPFRGGGRGRFNHRGGVSYRGRGRGLGDGQFPPHASGPANSNVAYDPAAAGATSVVQPSSSPDPTHIPTAPLQPLSRLAWCEICKVECNTPEVLEQHKNGKRHKKNMIVHEELQRLKATNGQESQPENVQESEKQRCHAENMGSEATASNHHNEIELQNNVGDTSQLPSEEPEENAGDSSAVLGRGFKRKIRGGRGGKFMRINDGSRKSAEPPKPKQATSFICELCNVKCESQVVYNSHLIGKKHLSSLKRVHGPQALYGEAGLQTLHALQTVQTQTPDISSLSNSTNVQVQQGVGDPQVLLAQLLMTVLSQVQLPGAAPPSGPAAVQTQAPISVAGSSHEPFTQNLWQTHGLQSTANVVSENPTGETQNQLLSVPSELDPKAVSSNNAQAADGSSETEVLKLSQDGSVMNVAESSVAANNQAPSECVPPTS